MTRSVKRSRIGLLVTFAILLAGVSPTVSYAAGPAPSWSVNVVSIPTVFPTNFESSFFGEGAGYFVTVTNVGGAASSGAVKVEDVLDNKVSPAVNKEPSGLLNISEVEPTCTVAGNAVVCESEQPIVPGETLWMRVPIDVPTSESESLTNRLIVSGGGAMSVTHATETEVGTSLPRFGFLPGATGFSTEATNEDGSGTLQAGGHPYQASIDLNFPTRLDKNQNTFAIGEPKDIKVTLPRGLVINPTATETLCTETQLESDEARIGCPPSSQVGLATPIVRIVRNVAPPAPIYNMVTAPGAPAELAFNASSGVYVHLRGHVRSNGEYEIASAALDTPGKVPVIGSRISLWGSPTDESHDGARFGAGCQGGPGGACSVNRLREPFLTSPSDCTGQPLVTSGEVNSWADPSTVDVRSALSSDSQGQPVAVTGCSALQFGPKIAVQPDTDMADSPTGLSFALHQTQTSDFNILGTSPLRDASVSLPDGLTVNPASANGLGACTEAEIGREPSVEGKLRFSEVAQTCPSDSKIGTVEVSTPLLSHSLPGSLFVATPFENPFKSLLAVYLVIEDPVSGIVAKLAGVVTPDPRSGQLSATFSENPELPIEDLRLHFFGGPAAALKSPLPCGAYATKSLLTPWSAPYGLSASPSDIFTIDLPAEKGQTCPVSEAAAPNTPSFVAGAASPEAGVYSPFSVNIERPDGSQHIVGIDTTLPGGLLGKLAGIQYCPESDIVAAEGRAHPNLGAVERAKPSCPADSVVGSVRVGAGAGPAPLYVSGEVYLAGPYKGAPVSLVVITPAIAGPFDLGNVVTRVALNVGLYSARIHAVSDPLPTILQGIPLDLRSIRLNFDRRSFTVNPTSCRQKSVQGVVATQPGQQAPVSTRFQVGQCGKLGFEPKLKLRLSGATRRSGHPALRAVLTYPKGMSSANIARAQVGLPHSEFLDQGNIKTVCTQPRLAADTCPKKSIYGFAKAWSPLLGKPLEGPVYLGVGFGNKLPDLVADLNGQIRVLVHGKVDTDGQEGLRNTFEAIPDAPISRFVLQLKGGPKKGLLENSENICRHTQVAGARFAGQNGAIAKYLVPIGNSC
jgi:hypothetical protein